MCSISGIWRLNGQPVLPNEIREFNNSTSYRGPDGEGIYLDAKKNLALGHRRLSIIDLSEAGKQPMFSADGTLVITYNGEIYNYLELKTELISKGHSFKTKTDTEVILAAYQEWGEDCLFKFNGMWALAIWDLEKNSLFLSRDRFGIKPLYYLYKPRKLFAFASETIAFKYLPGFERSVNSTNADLGIRNSFYLESIGETIYESIQKLLPGHYIKIDYKKNLVIKKWWKTEEHLPGISDNYNDQVEMFKDIFQDSCKLRLRSDVPIGIALSGGLDSSAVYCTIQQMLKTAIPVKNDEKRNWKNAFIACFPDTKMDEQSFADEVVTYTNGVANYIYPDQNDISTAIYNETKAEDFIYLSPPVVHNIYKEMRKKNVKVSLDGHGADELLFGYPHMVAELINKRKEGVLPNSLCTTWADMTGISYEHADIMFAEFREYNKTEPKNNTFNKYIPIALKSIYRNNLMRSKKNDSWMLRNTYFKKLSNNIPPHFEDLAFSICYNETHKQLPTLLRNWDRASMRHGVEIRMPFLDWRLVTFVLSLSESSKIGEGYSKKIVRDAMKGMMPDSIRLRKNKIGINAPLDEWFNGAMTGFLLDAVNTHSFLKSDIWNGPLIRDFVEKMTRERKWTQKDAMNVWPYLNAWILMN